MKKLEKERKRELRRKRKRRLRRGTRRKRMTLEEEEEEKAKHMKNAAGKYGVAQMSYRSMIKSYLLSAIQ